MTFLELRIPPVLQVIIIAIAMYGISKVFPLLPFFITGSAWMAAGLAIIGLCLGLMGVAEFKKAQTTVNPHTPENAVSLVTSGIYQYSRNPMYLGLVFILLGLALYLSHILAFALLPVFIIYMSRFQIQPEEKIMTYKFGNDYRAYLTQVRRWV
jgi:protein-S-isoprenylcysteine O-methyltransferase Ste14